MQYFRCLYYNALGRTENTVLPADDESELIRSFTGSGKTLVSIEKVESREAFRSKRGKTQNTVLQFTEMMELLLDSGLSLKEALEISAAVGGRNGVGAISDRMLGSVRKGLSFSKAVESAPELFPPIYRGMIRVGERIGSVERIFPRLASYLRDRKALKDKIAGALAYPVMVLSVAVLGAVGMSVFIIPKMEGIFSGFGGNATEAITKNIAAMKLFFSIAAAFLVAAVLAFPALHFAGKKSPAFALALQRLTVTLPLVGAFVVSWETLNFSFAMETLSAGGVPVEDAIEEAALVVSNAAYRDALLAVHADLLKGMSLSQAFTPHRIFPEYLQQWIAVGERSGKTEKVFSQIRSFYQAEVEKSSAKFMTLIEPALIVGIGVFLLVLIIGIVVPLFSMYGTLL